MFFSWFHWFSFRMQKYERFMYEYSNQIWYNTVLSCIRFQFYILVIFLWEKFRQFLKQDCVNKNKNSRKLVA
ncbi:MAG: hypothetical protein CO098_00270 [Bacteroidetes bacterium CG_4_9_14_3_um_filter_41_19]|nr:MAG: hypothetical protein CO098_00270 [Bacteroidetes bacterium CG_4_9_14_3_um_filter_41_19]